MNLIRIVTSIAVLVFLCACEINTTETKLQYMPDMADAPTVKAGENYLEPPEGSVQIDGILYPDDAETSSKLLKNPVPPSPEMVEKGKVLWGKFCITCHGEDGGGKNALGPNYPPVPNITEGGYTELSEGHIFHRITFGGALMPGYGHAISADERWQIIHYLRELQTK